MFAIVVLFFVVVVVVFVVVVVGCCCLFTFLSLSLLLRSAWYCFYVGFLVIGNLVFDSGVGKIVTISGDQLGVTTENSKQFIR